MSRKGVYECWREAGGNDLDKDRFRELLKANGHIIALRPGERRKPLPCGWEPRDISSASG